MIQKDSNKHDKSITIEYLFDYSLLLSKGQETCFINYLSP